MKSLPRRPNASIAEYEACSSSLLLTWFRSNGNCPGGRLPILNFDQSNATILLCHPRFLNGTAKVRVDASGRLQDKVHDRNVRAVAQGDTGVLFTNDSVNLAQRTNLYFVPTTSSKSWIWHTDTIADEYMNYFIRRMGNSSRLVDPALPVPKLNDIIKPLNKAYSAIFAIWLATNKDKVFTSSSKAQQVQMHGYRIGPERRIFVSKAMFIIAEVIICTYILAAILVYIRQPRRYLLYLPTSIASIIALFASSLVVKDIEHTSHLSRKERVQHLDKLDARYGYRSFISTRDGRIHIGIEKPPFVRRRPKRSGLDKRKFTFRSNSSDEIRS